MSQQKWFHSIGICGKTTSNVALMFKKMGWFVTGSDTQFIPPASNIINENNIPFELGYNYSHLTKTFWEERLTTPDNKVKLDISDHPNLALVIETSTLKNKEYLFAKKNNIDVRPYAQILKEYLIKPESIVIIGTAGKTTTTALLVWIFQALGLNPSYMVGADMVDIKSSLENTESKWSIIEGDEYHSLELSNGAKFLEYIPKYLIITKISWEHQDIFPTQQKYVNEFKKVVELIPNDGLIVAKLDDPNIDEVLKNAKCKVIRYTLNNFKKSNNSNEIVWRVERDQNNYIIFDNHNNLILKFETDLIGEYNLENILACVTLISNLPAKALPIELISQGSTNLSIISQAINSFHGVKKRLEFLYKSENIIIIDDFGIAPQRAKNSLETLKSKFSEYSITCVFEPNSGSRVNENNVFNKMYQGAFKNAKEVIIPDLSSINIELLNSDEMVNNLKKMDFNAVHIGQTDLLDYLKNIINTNKQNKVLIVFFSSYKLTQIAEDLTNYLNTIK